LAWNLTRAYTLGYARVSSHDQKSDLERQKEIIELFCAEGALADASETEAQVAPQIWLATRNHPRPWFWNELQQARS